MTSKEFLRKYHNYEVCDRAIAEEEAAKANKILVGDKAVVKRFTFPTGTIYCLMLGTAAEFIQELGY